MRAAGDFGLLRPSGIDEAVRLLARGGARLVAGGTDLMPNLRRGLLDPDWLVDLGAVAGLAAIERSGDEWRLGAGVTLEALERDEALGRAFPALVQAARQVAGPGHRSAATLGGNLCQDTRCVFYNQSAWWRSANRGCLKLAGDTCHVAPQGARCHAAYEGDLAPALLAYGAEIEIAGGDGPRRMPIGALHRDDGAAHLALAPAEIVAAVHLRAPAPGTASGCRKLRARGAIDFPLACVAVALRMHGDALAALSVAVSGTNPMPFALEGVDALLGRPLDEALLHAVATLVRRQVAPMRSTVTQAHYRREVAAVAARRLVSELAAPPAVAGATGAPS